MDHGEEINELCAGCHGEYGEGGKDGEYPRIAGQPAGYIAEQLHLFRDRKRPNIPMLEYMDERQMPDQDIIDISAYLSLIKLTTKLPPITDDKNFDAYERMLLTKKFLNIAKFDGDFEAGKKLYNKECKSCHGRMGEGKDSQNIPMLAGQYTNYLFRQIIKYNKKTRIHDKDSPEEDYFSEFTKEELINIFSYISIIDD